MHGIVRMKRKRMERRSRWKSEFVLLIERI